MTGPGPDGPSNDADRTDDGTPPSAAPSSDSNEPRDTGESHDTGESRDDSVSSRDDDEPRTTGANGGVAGENTRSIAQRGESARAHGESTRVADGESNGDPTGEAGAPAPTGQNARRVSIEEDGLVRWFFKTEDGTIVTIRDVLSSVAIVALIGLVLFGVSGVWPPMVAVESGSMEPNMERGDLIFVADENRFTGDDPIDGTGIVTLTDARNNGHEKFGEPGDVIIFMPNGVNTETPIIHRAHFWVEEGEDWVEEYADPEYMNGRTCDQLRTCPANHDGFVTKGDNNGGYDQAGTINTDVVEPEWVTAKGVLRIPWLGHVRLTFDKYLQTGPAVVSATPDGGSELDVSTTPTNGLSTTVAATAGATGVGVGSIALAGWRRYGG